MQYNTLLIDGPYLAHRSFDAPYKLTTSQGFDATMIHTFIRSLNSFNNILKPDRIIITWESPRTPSWRRQLCSTYKPRGARGALHPHYITQLKDLQDLLYQLKVKQYNSPNNEADDVLANYVEHHQDQNIIIYTRDKDIMQLINNKCHMFDGKQIVRIQDVICKFDVKPDELLDYLSIRGDKSDNIEGVEGYGPKKTVRAMELGTLSNAFSKDEMSIINRNRKLITLNKFCSIRNIPTHKPESSAEDILDKYELNALKEKLDEYKKLGDWQS